MTFSNFVAMAFWLALFILHPIIAITGNHLFASPNSGKAPLDVTFSVKGTNLVASGELIVDYGDNQHLTRICAAGCADTSFHHTYTEPGTYGVTAILTPPRNQPEKLGSRTIFVY
jgi:hypothetical protein